MDNQQYGISNFRKKDVKRKVFTAKKLPLSKISFAKAAALCPICYYIAASNLKPCCVLYVPFAV